jgi:hypothetical protein
MSLNPGISFVALLWTFSIAVICFFLYGFHITEKDIGVVVDDQLSFEEHMNEKINKANSIIGTY